MSIRSNTLPMGRDLAPELQDILRRNGMQGHIIRQGDGFALAVQGHDSPLLTYPINQQQMRAMVDWGTNSANKKAYNTFAAILSNDFYLPRSFVHARNANGRVAMGLHGYRIGVGGWILIMAVSLAGHHVSRKAGTCAESVEPCSCKVRRWFPTVLMAA